MVMPLCGTFHYRGVVPATRTARESGQWRLEDQSGAATFKKAALPEKYKFWKRRVPGEGTLYPLRDNRLVGLEPTVRIVGDDVVLEAAGPHRAQIRSLSMKIAPSLVDSLQGGDVLSVVRTATADVGLSVLREGRLVVGVGAVTVIPLGAEVAVLEGPAVDFSVRMRGQWPRRETWVEVSVSGETRRLKEGEETNLRNHRFSVLRCFQDGIPGTFECLAISRDGLVPHEAAMRSAELIARPNAGLLMADWS